MGSLGTFGGEIELKAFVEINPEYCILVFCHESDQPQTYGQGQKFIHLRYSGPFDEGHYDILFPDIRADKPGLNLK